MRVLPVRLSIGHLTLAILVLAELSSIPPEARAATSVVALSQKQFVPHEISVARGDTVAWLHADPPAEHTVTADDGSFDSHPQCGAADCMNAGSSYMHQFTQAGRFPYYCKIHGGPGQGMWGVVVVR